MAPRDAPTHGVAHTRNYYKVRCQEACTVWSCFKTCRLRANSLNTTTSRPPSWHVTQTFPTLSNSYQEALACCCQTWAWFFGGDGSFSLDTRHWWWRWWCHDRSGNVDTTICLDKTYCRVYISTHYNSITSVKIIRHLLRSLWVCDHNSMFAGIILCICMCFLFHPRLMRRLAYPLSAQI